MLYDESMADPKSFTEFGAMLRYLRRYVRLTQRELGIAVGYSEGHINRFEKNKHLPDAAAVAALFVPALYLTERPELAARLVELATPLPKTTTGTTERAPASVQVEFALEPIPPPVPHEIRRVDTLGRLRSMLAAEHRVVLCGLPGIGKTTLASTLAREYAQTMPVFWLTLTEGISRSVDTLLHQLAAFLLANGHDQVKPLITTDLTAKTFTLDRKIALLSAVLARQPALLCFDNAELIQRDMAWLQCVRHLLVTTPAFFLLTSREILPLANVAGITVYGFEPDEGRSFIAQISHYALSQAHSERLIEKTDGSPMLLQLAVGHLLDPRSDVESLVKHLETQPQVASYLLETIQRQSSSSAWRLLLLLAVFQEPANLCDAYLAELAHTLGDIENLGEAIAELQRRHLIGDASHAHLHPLIRDYVYFAQHSDTSLRQRLHRLAADWSIGGNQDAFAAAFHYSRAGLVDQTLDTLEENESAILGHRQGLATVAMLDDLRVQIQRLRTDRNERLRRMLTLRGILLAGTLRNAEGEKNLREAIALTTSPAVRAYTVYRLAELLMARSDFRESLRLVQAARAELAPNDFLLRARLAALECHSLGGLGLAHETEQAANEALALLDRLEGLPLSVTGDVRARAQFELANNARLRRDLRTAMEYGQSALASAQAAGGQRLTSSCLGFVGGLFYDLGDLEASLRYRQEALEGYQALGDIHSAAYVLTYLADIHHLRLEEDRTLEKLDQAAETLRIVEDMRGLAAAESTRSACLLWGGRVEQARSVIERVLREAEGKGTERLWGYRLNRLSIVQLVQGETETAIDTVQCALDLAATRANAMLRFELHSTLALAFAVLGNAASATQAFQEAPWIQGLSRWAEFDRTLIEGYVALAQADHVTARAHADQVAERAQNYPLYRQSAMQLTDAAQRTVPVSMFPHCLWVGAPITISPSIDGWQRSYTYEGQKS